MSTYRYPRCDPTVAVSHRLALALHIITLELTNAHICEEHWHLLCHNVHKLPPVLACFVGLGAKQCISYRIITFHNFHVLDVGITRLFCALDNTVVQDLSPLPLSHIMATLNNQFAILPPACCLLAHRPFRDNYDDFKDMNKWDVWTTFCPVFIVLHDSFLQLPS